MVRYRCDVCSVFEYDPKEGNSVTDIRPGTEVADFPKGWESPICFSDRTHLKPIEPDLGAIATVRQATCPGCGTEVTVTFPRWRAAT